MTPEPSSAATFRDVMEQMAKMEPPRFDRIAVRDMLPLAHIPRRDASGGVGHGLPLGLLGIPIVEDEEVEVGVIELRKGDQVVERLHLLELRA